MNKISQWFFRGLLAILPVGVTIVVLYWLGTTAEATLGRLLQLVLPANWYVPGLGIVSGFVFVIAIGLLVNAFIFRKLGQIAEKLLGHIPLVRLIYSSVRDIAKFASVSQQQDELQSAVLVTFDNNVQLIGFITDKKVPFSGAEQQAEQLYAVYLPMSYQMGGYTVFLPESRLQKLDMPIQDAMRYVLTAAMAAPESNRSNAS